KRHAVKSQRASRPDRPGLVTSATRPARGRATRAPNASAKNASVAGNEICRTRNWGAEPISDLTPYTYATIACAEPKSAIRARYCDGRRPRRVSQSSKRQLNASTESAAPAGEDIRPGGIVPK